MALHIMCDPIHGIMEIDKDAHEVIKTVIDTCYFQRLRHIKQLSFAEFAYPGAVHNRFSHCIGVSYLANKIYNALDFRKEDINTRSALLLAALMHDIGHGPFSHVFESVTEEMGLHISHETWSSKFITQIISENPKFSSQLILAKSIFEKKEGILSKVITSQLDVDRLDYLLRDSHFCGVSYGNFDLYWLISCIKTEKNELIISEKGVKALEHYIMARRLMNQNVYFHKIKCSAEYLLKIFFKTLCAHLDQSKKTPVLRDSLFTKFFIQADKIKKTSKLNEELEEEDIPEDLFKLYARMADHDFWSLMKNLTDIPSKYNNEFIAFIKEIGERFSTRTLPKVYRINSEFYDFARKLVNEEKQKLCLSDIDKERFCLIKHPIGIYKTNKEAIFVEIENTQSYCNVLAHSQLLKLFSEEDICYVYYMKSNNNTLNESLEAITEKLRKHGCLDISSDGQKETPFIGS
ncbi:HD domain-containing protein [Legionella sp. 227]|uniref:HD domain-containing protein n=1 Tax=Legionella sp. 227 TaxID=3367288 RepID=UPI00370CFE03